MVSVKDSVRFRKVIKDPDRFGNALAHVSKSERDGVVKIISSLANLDSRGVVVTGIPVSGKSFMIDLVVNATKYWQNIGCEKVKFLEMREGDTTPTTPLNPEEVIQEINSYLGIPEPTCGCIITGSSAIAEHMYNLGYRVILEVNEDVVEQLAQRPVFSSWGLFDTRDINPNYNELAEELQVFASDSFFSSLILDDDALSREEAIRLFVDEFLKFYLDDSTFYEQDGVLYAYMPPGRWASAFKRFSYAYAMLNGEITGSFDTDNCIEKVDEAIHEDIMGEVAIETAPEEHSLTDLLQQVLFGNMPSGDISRGAVIQVGAPQQVVQQAEEPKQKEETQPLQFQTLQKFKQGLESEIFGQEKALQQVVDRLIVPMAGLNAENKPLSTMLFLGPTGVGKTETALSISRHLLKNEEMNVIRLDMSEYSQKHEVSKLFGAPAGYIGSDEGGMLVRKIMENPRSVLLLDEVEKAHPLVWDSFLQVFDTARMTDSRGIEADFSQTIVVMTSNLGSRENAHNEAGFSISSAPTRDKESTTMRAVEEFFKPEFLNRVDTVVHFDNLTSAEIEKIFLKEVDKVGKALRKRGYTLQKPSRKVTDLVTSKSNIAKYGARDIQRLVQDHIAKPTAYAILADNTSSKGAIVIDADGKNFKAMVA